MAKQAIEGKRLNAFGVDPDDLTIIDDPEHPQYDERVELEVDENLVLNIMEYGVIEPVIVSKDGDDVLVVAGRQRVKAAREANRRIRKVGGDPIDVPCMVRRGDDDHLIGVAVSENEHRRGDTAMAKARRMGRLAQRGWSNQKIAGVYKLVPETVAAYLLLLDCIPAVQKAVEEGRVNVTVARKLGKLPKAEQKPALDELLEKEGKVRPRDVAAVTKATSKATGRPKPKLLQHVYRTVGTTESKAPSHVVDLLGWVVGEVSDDLAFQRMPWLRSIVETAAAKKAKEKAAGAVVA